MSQPRQARRSFPPKDHEADMAAGKLADGDAESLGQHEVRAVGQRACGVAADAQHCVEVLDACERLVAAHPEVDVLSARSQLYGKEDEE